MSDNSDMGAFLAGFVIGGLVGAAAAIILAPQSGAETRAQLMDLGDDLRRGSTERAETYRRQAEEYMAGMQDRMNETTGQLQEQMRIVLDEGRGKITTARENMMDTVGQVRQQAAEKAGEAAETLEEAADDIEAAADDVEDA